MHGQKSRWLHSRKKYDFDLLDIRRGRINIMNEEKLSQIEKESLATDIAHEIMYKITSSIDGIIEKYRDILDEDIILNASLTASSSISTHILTFSSKKHAHKWLDEYVSATKLRIDKGRKNA